MGYVIAAYGITAVALVGYASHLLRERSRLRRERSELLDPGPGGAGRRSARDPGDRSPNTG
jgi:heme exporter protein CcmD